MRDADKRFKGIGKHEVKPDAELYEAAIAGGPEAFAPIVGRYKDAVFAVALARVRDFHDAEDISQNVFIAAFERLRALKDPRRLGAWLRSMTVHQSIDFVRRSQRIARGRRGAAVPRGEGGPHAQLERKELREQVLAAIGRLSKAKRETTALFYVDGYSVEEVAGIQELPVGTVKSRLHDAREKLREEMIHVVEDVLKSEAPKEDFAKRVFGLLLALRPREGEERIPWEQIVSELRKIGSRGIDGFVKALQSPHSPTRATAAAMLCKISDTRELVVELLKNSLTDPNKKVRRFAVDSLMNINVDQRRKREEFVPLVLPLLRDRSIRVRRRAAYSLEEVADAVPIDQVAEALLGETDPPTRVWIGRLLRCVLNARAGQENST